MDLTSASWNSRYVNAETQWDIGGIASPFLHYFGKLTNKQAKILIPGGGRGYEVEYLYTNGFQNVTMLDWAAEPLADFRKRVPGFPAGHLVQADFFRHKGQYDLIIEHTFLSAIHPGMRTLYAAQMHSLLAPGGHLAGVVFKDFETATEPPFGGSEEQYLKLFEPLFEIEKFEECYNSIERRAGRELWINLVKKELPRK